MEIHLDDDEAQIVHAVLATSNFEGAAKIAERILQKSEDEKLGAKKTFGDWRLNVEAHGTALWFLLSPDDYDRQDEGIHFEGKDLKDLAACLAEARAQVERHRQRCQEKLQGE